MTVEEVRRRLVEEEVRLYRGARMRDAILAALCLCGAALLLALTLPPAAEWARGDWLRPGGWMHDRFGLAGAVAILRGSFAGLGLLSLAWLAGSLWVRSAGLDRRRARIEREQPRLRRPGELAGAR